MGVASADLAGDFKALFQGGEASLEAAAAGFGRVSETIDNELQRTMVPLPRTAYLHLLGSCLRFPALHSHLTCDAVLLRVFVRFLARAGYGVHRERGDADP
jgi:hypothetical protein